LEVAGRTDIPVAEGSHVTITVCTHSSLLNRLCAILASFQNFFNPYLLLVSYKHCVCFGEERSVV
jgi:hypothetical protein